MRRHDEPKLATLLLWLVGHARRVLPIIVIALAVGLSWGALREIHPGQVRQALRAFDPLWLAAASVATLLNIGVMGLYDVLVFAHTRSRWTERWRYGAVAFAWSNFLTLGPLAGPAVRFWLYRPAVDKPSDIEGGVVSIAVAFTSGLAGWTAAALVVPHAGSGVWDAALGALALVFGLGAVGVARAITNRIERLAAPTGGAPAAWQLALVGWLDWALAATAYVACMRSTGVSQPIIASVRSFFLGQVVGLVSLVPGGFGSSDAFWIAHLPLTSSVATAALLAYRFIYYVVPWVIASLLLLSWATHRATRRIEIARRLMAGLAAAAGILILASTATPALAHRLAIVDDLVPLPLVEFSHFAAAATGVLLLVVARGMSRGYAAACDATVVLLVLAAVSAILKGLDYEEASVLGLVAGLVFFQRPMFDRPSRGDWIEARDLGVAFVALLAFILFGVFAHRVFPHHLSQITTYQYPETAWFALERSRFLRVVGGLILALFAAAGYVLWRVPVRFRRLQAAEIESVLDLHGQIGSDTTPMMVANGDKDAFIDGQRGFCLYRTTGPYLVVLSDPVVRGTGTRGAFLDALFDFAGEIDRRPVFYQVSVNWIPPLHDRGYAFFKLGEEARVSLEKMSLEGHAGKESRQFLRRAEREGLRFRVMPACEVERALPELHEVSSEWLRAKGVRERQFSIGFFDPEYLKRFPCAIVEDREGRIVGFANVLAGPKQEELSVDLMRYRTDGPKPMDFMFTSLMLYGKERGYKWFNMGMAPLASVGELRGAHSRERLANLLFQHGETWYNFQGLRQYKEKFSPEWVPRYMAYQNPWEWPIAIGYVSALIAGGWGRVLRGGE